MKKYEGGNDVKDKSKKIDRKQRFNRLVNKTNKPVL